MNNLQDVVYGIVGLGIMGGSVAKAIRANVLDIPTAPGKIFACDALPSTLDAAVRDGVIDKGFASSEAGAMLSECDIVYVCLYPHATLEFIKAHRNDFKSASIVTDISGIVFRDGFFYKRKLLFKGCDMRKKFVFICEKQFRPQGCVDHRDARQVFKTSAAEFGNRFVFGAFDQGGCDDVAQLTRKSDFSIMSFAVRFDDACKAHRGDEAFYECDVFGSIRRPQHQNIISSFKIRAVRIDIAFFFSAGHRVPEDKIDVVPRKICKTVR